MNCVKKNIKLIIGIIIGIIVTSGIGFTYATYKYFATEVSYVKDEKEMSVEEALNELYTIKRDYIKPSGTLEISEKNNQIDVSQYQYADTSKLYTESETTGEGKYWQSGKVFCNSSGTMKVTNLDFKPTKVFCYTTFVQDSKTHSAMIIGTSSNATVWWLDKGLTPKFTDNYISNFKIKDTGFEISAFTAPYVSRNYEWVALK